jgi:hypothetical protein
MWDYGDGFYGIALGAKSNRPSASETFSCVMPCFVSHSSRVFR